MSRSGLMVLVLSAAVLAAAGLHAPPRRHAAAGLPDVPLATPPGITLQLRRHDDRRAPREFIFADASDLTLYELARDPPDHPTCAGGCAKQWPPAEAPAAAKATTEWGILVRPDGTRQWTHRGHPLYRYAADTQAGAAGGDGADGGAWHVVPYEPGNHLALPDGIGVRELGDAGGAGLVDAQGMTLYVSDKAPGGSPCARCVGSDVWQPLEAPAIAGSVGDFSAVARRDGITQWAFQGRLLYRYRGDRKPDDVTGAELDARFRPALVAKFYMPADAAIRRHPALGAILTTRSGNTLYQRDLVINSERHEFRTDHGPPALGRSFGTASCDADCTREWRPFAAPADAVSSGYWDVVRRADGSRQWAYKGFALYTFVEDRAGEVKGHERHTLGRVYDDSGLGPFKKDAGTGVTAFNADAYVGAGGAAAGIGISALFWHAVVP